MDRSHKAEIRNIELENTIKTLQTRIKQISIIPVVNNCNPTTIQSKNKDEEDELIIGMRKRVTKFVLKTESVVDIFLLQEHWLFDCQLPLLNEINDKFTGVGKSVDTLDPIPPIQMHRGMVALLYFMEKRFRHSYNTLTIGNERMQGIEISGEPNLIILSIYLPCKGTSDHINEFQDCIALLHEIVCTYKLTHQIIIGGDLNEDIINGPSSQRKASFTEFMEDHSLETKFTGSTFIHSNGHETTAIDYFIFQNSYKNSILEIKKLDIGTNVSDHYPIKMVLQHRHHLNQQKSPNDILKPKINWDRIDKEKYENNINSKLSNKILQIKSVEDITKAFTQLNEINKQSTQALVPTRKIDRKRPKLQVMNDEIKDALKNKKFAFYKWKINGRPKETDNLYLKNKKHTTHAL
ncbi:Hypothetical predicted protein [Mytilus galloprovincialis]|uniref:Endonuclease/exonuclease/phosphatase domain-containing protein n=1 Tax=Mytilus galloprovincialis TaxID=29158 RepID=A0A8B6DG00_MYTGA|nr:Hypothetical predicted protein [Mytilus galloprovincialis]